MLRRRFTALVARCATAREMTTSSSSLDVPEVAGTEAAGLESPCAVPSHSALQAATQARRGVLSRVLERAADTITRTGDTNDATAASTTLADTTASVMGVSCPPTRSPDTTEDDDDDEAALGLFAQAFSTTLHVVEQHPHARVLERAGSPVSASTTTLSDSAAVTTALTLASPRQANVLQRLVETQHLTLACVALCQRAWQRHLREAPAVSSSESAAAELAEALLAATNTATRPVGLELRYRRRVMESYLRRRFRGNEEAVMCVLSGRTEEMDIDSVSPKALKAGEAVVKRVLFSGTCDTSTSILGRTVLQLFLARELIESTIAIRDEQEAAFVRHVAHAMLAKLTAQTYRLDHIDHVDGVRSESLHGLDALLRTLLLSLDEEHSKLHRHATTTDGDVQLSGGGGGGEQADGSRKDRRRYRTVVRSHLRALLGLYAALLPHVVTAAVAFDARLSPNEMVTEARDNDEDEKGETEETDEAVGKPPARSSSSASTHVVRLVQTLRDGWNRGARQVRLEGPSSAAVWWLQTAAVTMDAFAACGERVVQHAGDGVVNALVASGDATVDVAAAEVALLTTIQAELGLLLNGFFHYNRAIYAHYRSHVEATSASKAATAEAVGEADASAPGGTQLPRSRRRGRRSLFHLHATDDGVSDGSRGSTGGTTTASGAQSSGGVSGSGAASDGGEGVLRQVVASESAVDVRRRGASRFVTRNRVLLQDGLGDANRTSPNDDVIASTTSKRGRKKAGAHAAQDTRPSVPETEDAFSALFHVFVLLRTSVGALAAQYGITNDRSGELEETWLNVLQAMQRLQGLVLSPRPEHEVVLDQQRKLRFRHAAENMISAARAHGGKARQPKRTDLLLSMFEPSSTERQLPLRVQEALDRVRARLLQHALSADTGEEKGDVISEPWDAHLHRIQQAVVRALDGVTTALPSTAPDSALLITNRLTEALLTVVDRSEDLALSATQRSLQSGVTSRDWSTLQGLRRSLVTVLAVGAQEVVLGNRALRDGDRVAWWHRRFPLVVAATHADGGDASPALVAQPTSLGFSRRLLSATAALQSRHRFLSMTERLQSAEDAVTCLERYTRADASAVSLDMASRQALVTGALSQLLAIHHDLRFHGGGSRSGAGALARGGADDDVAARVEDPVAAQARAENAYRRLVALVREDAELLLLSSFASALSAWHAASKVFASGSGGGGGGGGGRAADLSDSSSSFAADLVPLAVSAVIASLVRSRLQDNPSTHASLCEHTLLMLSALAEHAEQMSPHGVPSVRGTTTSLSQWRAALAQVCTYCMAWATRDPGAASSTLSDHATVFVTLYTRYALPQDVPWREELDRRLPPASALRALLLLPSDSSRASTPALLGQSLAHSNYLLLLDHSTRLPFGGSHFRPYHSTLHDRSLDALREYHHALHSSTAFDMLDAFDTPETSETTVKARQHVQHQRARVWHAQCAEAQRCARPLLGFDVADVLQSRALHPLVRFVERHASQQLLLSTQLAPATPSKSPVPTTTTTTTAQSSSSSSSAVALDAHTTALLLLRFIGDLYQSHSWAMVCLAFRVAQLAHRAEVLLGTREGVSLRVAGLSTVLGLLQEMPAPYGLVHLRPTFLTVLLRFSDMLSGTSTTLLGMRNGSAVRGWLARPNRDVYRGAIFAVKQMVLYVQHEASWFCADAASLAWDSADRGDGDEEAHDGDVDVDEPSPLRTRPTRAAYYTDGYRAVRDAATVERDFVLFVSTLRCALELVLECVRHHALQQRVMDAELTRILTACYDVLCQLFCDATKTALSESKRSPSGATDGDATAGLVNAFADERAELLLAGLSLVATMNVVQQHDPAGIFFHGRAQRRTEAVVAAVDALLDATPVVHAALYTGFRRFVLSGFYQRDLSWRLGTILYGRADVTVMVVALSTFAGTAIRQPAAAQLYAKTWSRLQSELLQFTDDGDEDKKAEAAAAAAAVPSAKTARRKPSKRHTRPAQGGKRLDRPMAFCVPSKQEFLLAASAFNELEARFTQTHSDAQSLQGGMGLFTARRDEAARDQSPTTPTALRAPPHTTTPISWVCDPEKLAAGLVENAALMQTTLSEEANAVDAELDEDTENTAVLAGTGSAGGAAPLTTAYRRVGFVFNAYVDVAEAAAEGVLSPDEIIGAVIQQSLDLGLVSAALTADGAGAGTVVNGMTPQVRAVMSSYLRNLVALFELYSLEQICAHEKGAAPLFRLLEPWLALRELSELARTERATASRLWVLLAYKFRTEAMDPHDATFAAYQSQLLGAAFLARVGNDGGGAAAAAAAAATTAATAATGMHTRGDPSSASHEDIFFQSGWFASAAREAAAGLYAPADMVELTCHDDVRHLLPRSAAPAVAPGKRAGKSRAAITYTTTEALRTPVFKAVVPLEVTMVLLRALLRGDRRVVEVRDLADCVTMYAARQYVLLRTRLDGSAVNTLSVLLSEPSVRGAVLGDADAAGATAAQARAQARLWISLGLPTRSVQSERVADHLFSPEKRAALVSLFGSAGLDVAKDAGGSLEHATFDYLRCVALYLKVLSTIASVLLRYKLFGDLVDDSVRALFSRASAGADGIDLAASDVAVRRDSEASTAHRQLMRQTQPASVNRNTFESVMLHYLNVSVALTKHADVLYHVAADRALDLATGASSTSSAFKAGQAQPQQEPQQAHGREPVRGASEEALMAYAEEIRHLAADAVQTTLSSLGFLAGRTDLCHVRCAAHLLISGCSCDPLSLQNGLVPSHRASSMSDLAAKQLSARRGGLRLLTQQHPPVTVGSPTMLAVLTPTYFERSLTYTMPRAQSAAVTPIAASLTFYMQQRHVALVPLLSAVAELLASTTVRNSALKMLCEKLARALLERPDFRLALAPPTVASGNLQSVRSGHLEPGTAAADAAAGAAGSLATPGGHAGASSASSSALPNEILIPFLAAMTRGDVQITKSTLAKLLHTAMAMRTDVFGEPPVAVRQARLSLVSGGGAQRVGGSFDLSNPLYRRRGESPHHTTIAPGDNNKNTNNGDDENHDNASTTAAAATEDPLDDGARQSQQDLALLSQFSASSSSDSTSATHRRALASLNLSLSAAMEVAMHLGAARHLTKAEAVRARSLLRAADDARRERVGAYRSLLHAAKVSGHARPGESAVVRPVLDAALHLEDPMDYGVAVLHIQFALRKVVHAAFRRLGPHQTPASLAMMTDMLYSVDPGFRGRRDKDPAGGALPGGTKSGTAARLAHTLPAVPLDPMLTSTIRILLSRARLSAQAVGYGANGAPQQYLTLGTSHDASSSSSAESPLYQPVLFPLTSAHDAAGPAAVDVEHAAAWESERTTPAALQLRQKLEEEAAVSVALTTSVMAASAKMKMRQAVRAALRQSRSSQSRRRRHEQQQVHHAKAVAARAHNNTAPNNPHA